MTSDTAGDWTGERPTSDPERARQRRDIEAEVDRRATLESRGDVAVLVALANAEKQFRRDYSGRFLIELVQNARDAWVKANGTANNAALVVAVTDQPAFMVGNAGDPISADVLLYSIGLVGESTKDPTQSIGHKGVGIKAILGVSDRPEIYSRLDPQGPFDVQVGFDRERALERVRTLSGTDTQGRTRWKEWLKGLPGAASAKGIERVPLLAFPFWIEDAALDPGVEALQAAAETPLNTVVRLPYVGPDDGRGAWLDLVAEAIDGLSDEMLLLLGSFATVRILRPDGQVEILRVESAPRSIDPGAEPGLRDVTAREVTVTRSASAGDTRSTSWLLYEGQLESVAADGGVDAGLAVGIRVERRGGRLVPMPVTDDPSGTKFHLFFPTEIPTHLPFLLHAYFEVEGSRKRFADDSHDHNQARLDGLRSLTRLVMADLVAESEAGRFDLTPLPTLMSVAARPPDDRLARDGFHGGVLEDLRRLPWIAAAGLDGHPAVVAPSSLLIGGGIVGDHLLRTAFPQQHVLRHGRRYPDPSIAIEGLQFLAALEPSCAIDKTTVLQLLSPIDDHDPHLWPLDDADTVDIGFSALLEVLIALAERSDRKAFAADVAKVNGRFIPVVEEGGNARRLVGPQPVEGGSGRQALFVRTGEEASNQISVPAVLQMAFLPDGVIGQDRVSHAVVVDLGIRPFDTNSILMRLTAVLEKLEPDAWTDAASGSILRFVAALLASDRQSSYRLREVDAGRDEFTPAAHFWVSDKERDDRRRRFGLSLVHVPTKQHGWQPAATCVVGVDWGERLKAVDPKQSRDRVKALAELHDATPAEAPVVAGPDVILDAVGLDSRLLEHFDEAEAASQEQLVLRAAHALLLRLGAWEILPLVAAHDFNPGAGFDPFAGHLSRTKWRERVEKTKGASFDRDGRPADRLHAAWSVGEDYRLLWDMPPDRPGFAKALGVAARFLGPFLSARLLCQGCAGWHSVLWRSGEVESFLRYQLQRTPWLGVTIDGAGASGFAAVDSWWEPYVPAGPGFKTSPLRYLALADGIDDRVADLVALPSLASDRGPRPNRARISNELRRLRDQYVEGTLIPDPQSSPAARQAFVALHRRLYGLLAPIMNDRMYEFLGRRGVLAERGGSLVWAAPEDARFDDRNYASYRGAFEDAVAFSILPSDERSTATALGVVFPFEVDEERNTPEWERDVTDVVRPVLTGALPRLFALLVHDPIGGGTPLRLEGDELAERARRVASMQVFQVSSLSIQATEKRSRISRQVGVTDEEDAYLDRSTPGRARLYHEFQGDDWLERLRPVLGAHLARLLDSASHEDAFARLLAGSEMAQDRLLRNRGITPERIRAVRERLRDLDLLDEELDRNWWAALLEVLHARPWTSGRRSDLGESLSDALASIMADQAAAAEATAEILRSGAGPGVRDASSDGREVLSLLARIGVSLEALHVALRQRGDGGLRIDIADRRLAGWRRAHDADLLVALTHRASISADEALARVNEVTTDPGARFDPEPGLDAWLDGVVQLLWSVQIEMSAAELCEPDFTTHLRTLLGLDAQTYDERRGAAFDTNLRAALERRNADAWKAALIPVVVAMTVDPTALDGDLRDTAQLVRDAAPVAVRPAALVPWFSAPLAETHAALSTSVQRRLEEAGWEHAPDLAYIDALVSAAGRAAMLDRVRAAVARTPGPRVLELRSAIKRLRAARGTGAILVPVEVQLGPGHHPDGPGKPQPEPDEKDKKDVAPGSPPDGRGRERSGRAAELVVLASMVEYLSGLPDLDRRARLEDLKVLLRKWFRGAAVAKLLAAGAEAQSAAPGDELDDALVRFLHAADCSPAFGFDVLGFVFDREDHVAPDFLEVKAVGRTTGATDREIHVPVNEWAQAERIGPEYAFLLVSHDAKGGPATMEAIVGPAGKVTPDGTLTRSVEQYRIAVPRAVAEAQGAAADA